MLRHSVFKQTLGFAQTALQVKLDTLVLRPLGQMHLWYAHSWAEQTSADVDVPFASIQHLVRAS